MECSDYLMVLVSHIFILNVINSVLKSEIGLDKWTGRTKCLDMDQKNHIWSMFHWFEMPKN